MRRRCTGRSKIMRRLC
uniref:Uncharacterized protein n=1 Tax=Romanomermis culicivorax TaxID=13658 RepID=A0A915IQV9_ROMCU